MKTILGTILILLACPLMAQNKASSVYLTVAASPNPAYVDAQIKYSGTLHGASTGTVVVVGATGTATADVTNGTFSCTETVAKAGSYVITFTSAGAATLKLTEKVVNK
jgi:hypothetical protein